MDRWSSTRESTLKFRNSESQSTPLIFEDTPPAVAIGRLCEDGPFDFVWRNKTGKPTLTNVDTGRSNVLRVQKYVPMIPGSVFLGPSNEISIHNSFLALQEQDEEWECNTAGIDNFDESLRKLGGPPGS